MPTPPLHKVCGTAHWSTQPCPALRSATPRPLPRTTPDKIVANKTPVPAPTAAVDNGDAVTALARIKEQTRLRVQKHRAAKKK